MRTRPVQKKQAKHYKREKERGSRFHREERRYICQLGREDTRLRCYAITATFLNCNLPHEFLREQRFAISLPLQAIESCRPTCFASRALATSAAIAGIAPLGFLTVPLNGKAKPAVAPSASWRWSCSRQRTAAGESARRPAMTTMAWTGTNGF